MATDKDDVNKHVSIAPSDIFKVGVRVPPFWPEEPEIWFSQLEGQFANAGISSDTTKFYYVISQLDRQFSKEVKDIIVNPPENNKYAKIKAELIKRLSDSRERKMQQLLMHEELGDRKPSQFLRHLEGLADRQLTDEFLRTIWVSRLPPNIQTVLAAQPATPLEVLAEVADRVHDIASPSAVNVASTSNVSAIDTMAREIAEIKEQLKNLSMHSNRRPRPRSRDYRGRSRSRSNYRKFPNCWYHSKYGETARKCVKPCDFKKAGNATSRR